MKIFERIFNWLFREKLPPQTFRQMPVGEAAPGLPKAEPRYLPSQGFSSPEEAAAFFGPRYFEKDGVRYAEIWYEESEVRPPYQGCEHYTYTLRCVTKRELRVYPVDADGKIIPVEDKIVTAKES